MVLFKRNRSSSTPDTSRQSGRGRFRTIQAKTLLKLLPAALPMLLVVFVGYRSSSSMARQSGERLSSLVVRNGAAELNICLASAGETFSEWVREDVYGLAIEFDTTREIGSRLSELLNVAPDFSMLLLTNENGKVLEAALQGGDGTSLTGQTAAEVQRSAGSGKYSVRRSTSSLLGKAGLPFESTYVFTFPTRSSDGNVNGYLVGYLDWGGVEARIAATNERLIENGYPDALTMLFDSHSRDTLVLATPAGHEGEEPELGSAVVDWVDDWEHSESIEQFEINGTKSYVTFTTVHGPLSLSLAAGTGESDGASTTGDEALSESTYSVTAIIPERDILAESQRAMVISLALALGSLLMLVALIWFAGGSISKPIRHMVELVKDIAEGEGDLTRQLQVDSDDELGELAGWFNAFVEKLQGIISRVGDTTNSLNGSAEGLTTSSGSITESADQTSAQANLVANASEQVDRSVQVVAAATEEMSASIREIAKNASRAAKVSSTGVEVAETANTTIAKLGESSAEIDNVIKVITSIAEQTNLLALNTTVESASAGEAGKGFAVVANEVKELAKETANATEDISRKIETIQADTRSAVEAIGQITAIVTEISDLQNAIASSVEEQTATTEEMGRSGAEAAQGSTEIAKSIAAVAEGAQATTEGAKNGQQGAQDVARISEELSSLIGQFKY